MHNEKKTKKQQVIMVHYFGQHAISMPSTTHWCKWELPVQSVHITTDVVSSNPTNSEVYSIQHYMIKFVSDLRHVRVFSGYSVSSINKTDCHNNWNTVESGVKHHKKNKHGKKKQFLTISGKSCTTQFDVVLRWKNIVGRLFLRWN